MKVACTIAFGGAALLSGICLIASGDLLGLSLAGFFFITTLLPPLLLTERSFRARLQIAGCAVGGIAVVWFVGAMVEKTSLVDSMRCCVVLICYAIEMIGLTAAILHFQIANYKPQPASAVQTENQDQTDLKPASRTPTGTSAIAILLSLLWLTWPIWLAHGLTGAGANTLVATLISIHPLFAINGVLADQGTWSHWAIAYRWLTTLGQDIPYSLPTSIWPACLAHLFVGGLLAAIGGERWFRKNWLG